MVVRACWFPPVGFVRWLLFVGLWLALVPVALDVAWIGLPVVGFVG